MTVLEAKPRIFRMAEPGSILTAGQQWLYLGLLSSALGYAIFQNGARELFDWNIALLIIGVCAGWYYWRTQSSDCAPPIELPLGWLALLIPAYVVFQLIPLPVAVIQTLSPERAHLLDGLRAMMPVPGFAPLSLAYTTTFAHLFRMLGYLLVFFLVRDVAGRSRQPWVVVVPLLVIAAIEAAFGIAQDADGQTAVSGTYANRNHFAGLLEMVLPLTITYGISLLKGRPVRGGRTPGSYVAAGALVLLSAILMLTALSFSLSKAGFVACLGSLFFVATVACVVSIRGRKKWLSLILLGVFFALLFVFVPPDQMVSAFGSSLSDSTGEGRVPIWHDSLNLLKAYPVVGSGLGTYDTAFLKYQTAEVDLDFNFAHNDYLEFATELGAAGFVLLLGFVVFVFGKALRTGTRKFDQNTRYLAWGCAGSVAAIGLHSFTDFNMYIPANAVVLAWVLGIAASFPARSVWRAPNPKVLSQATIRGIALAFCGLLLVYAPAWILLEGKLEGDPRVERKFCAFGVCDTDAAIASETAKQGGNVASVPVADLLEAVRRDSAAPLRWCDLGDALVKTGQMDRAAYSFAHALKLGPNIPPVQLRAVNFYSSIHDRKTELEQASGVLEKSEPYDGLVFDRYLTEAIPLPVILRDGLPKTARARQAYLRYLMARRNFADAATTWDWILSQNDQDPKLAHDYVNFLFSDHQYGPAARAWARYLGDHGNGYLVTNWLYNGDFEAEPSGVPFDWTMDSGDDVDVALDAGVAHSGTHSLRIRFGGKKNVNYAGVMQTAVVEPGTYRFTAFVRTAGITTDKGIFFHIFGADADSHLDVRTPQFTGTTDWTKVEQEITVSPGGHLIAVQLMRPASLRFDSLISGTAWIDTVSLSKVE